MAKCNRKWYVTKFCRLLKNLIRAMCLCGQPERQAQIGIDESVQSMQDLSELSRSKLTIDGRIGRVYDGFLQFNF